ncbi:hypothetical protein PGT21_034682 [Puccinia graminis f. sp. tritici]|uniref:Uncharacterized protein n=1 Tax=Puccinia graminis f. sp. tritici TaxID=56615 RepID=A0A5B0QD60_PUCGR|nr:hypothetical protein PGT21_034682 [Puccinia graminis f. sp. tritici]
MASTAEIESLIPVALEQQAQQMQAQLASRDEVISKLIEKVELKEAETSTNLPPQVDKGKSAAKKAKPHRAPANRPKASTSAHTNSKSQTPTKSSQPSPRRTPSGSQRKRVATPKTSSPKTHPCQMVSRDMPESFAPTRDALYVHIKIIWNLLEQKTIPGPPHPDTLRELTASFSNADEITQRADDASGAALIPVRDVVTLKGLQLGQKKVGKGLVNLEEFFVSYTQAVLARLGIRVWAPDLEDFPDSLYNKACRQAALKSFCQAAVGGAYAYMNINKKYATDLALLIPAYNHFVQFLQTTRYNREKNQTGKFRMDEERRVISKAREQLRDTRLKFALNQNLPKRYQRIISDVNCHSNDEYSPKKAVYIVKTLKFWSENATKFFRHLDIGRVGRPTWFKDLLPQQRMEIANTREVAFLPDASQSLMGKHLPSEKLSDKKFIQEFFDRLSQPYDLSHEIEDNGEGDEETDDEDDASFNGEEIDLANTSNEDDDEDEADEDDEEFVDNSMDTSNHGNEDDSEEDEEELAQESRYNAMLVDEEL